MKAILYIVAIVVAIGAAVLSFRFSTKFEDLQQVRIKTTAESTTKYADVIKKGKELEARIADLNEAKNKCLEVTQKVAALEGTGKSLTADLAKKEEALVKQKSDLEEAKKVQETITKILGELGGDVTLDNLGDKIAEVEASKKTKQESLDETTKKIEDTDKILATNRTESDRLTKRIIERTVRINRNAQEAVVTAVDQDWGILVIGAGSNSGFTPQTALLVMRDGRLIGRVRPSSIEPNQTIAEIDFKSMASGARIMPGDRVMLGKPNTN